MIPEVTVAPRPRGKPTAKTASPSRSAEERARGSGTRSVARTRMTARSFSGAVPITVPAIGRLCTSSLKTTVTRVVPSTTWLFVRMIPRRSSTIPEPSPRPPPKDLGAHVHDRREDACDGVGERACAVRGRRGGRLRGARLGDGDRLRRRRGRCAFLLVPAAAGERRRREQGDEEPHGSLGNVTTAMPAAASSRTSPPARNANVTSCLRFTWLTSDPILSYASRRSPTLSAS